MPKSLTKNYTNKHYILKGKKVISVSLEVWGEWFKNYKDRIVKQEYLEDGTLISTVFLGLDHAFGSGGNKLIVFETMVFKNRNKLNTEEYMERYSTWDEAIKGHNRIRKMLPLWRLQK